MFMEDLKKNMKYHVAGQYGRYERDLCLHAMLANNTLGDLDSGVARFSQARSLLP